MADDVITTALERFKLAADAEADIRKASLEDMKFVSGEHWPEAIRKERDAERRPCLNIPRLPQFTRQVTNDQRMNRPSLKIDPTDDSTIDTAEIMEGLVRHIQVSSNADIAYATACKSQVDMGWGYFRLISEYCNENSFEEELKIKRIKNPFTVYFDPYCAEPDYSDAKWAFIATDVPTKEFKSTYKGKEDYSDESFSSIGDAAPMWHTADTIRIAEYFTVEETEKTIYLLQDGSVTDHKPEDASLIVKERLTTNRKVMWRKITGLEELDKKEWPGKYIPIVPVLGEDIDIDGKRILKGMVRDAQDAQRMYNYWVSAQTEAIALAPKAPFIMAEGQVEGFESMWRQANTRSYPYLTYRPQTINGTLIGAPQRQQAEPPVQAITLAIQQASEDLKNTTGIYNAGLGKREGDASGIALKQLDKTGDIGNFHWQDNLARSIRFLGIILLDLIPKKYDAPRVVRILHEDGEAELIKINQLFEHKGKQVNYDLTSFKGDVVVNVGPSFTTKRQEAADAMATMAQAYPPLMQLGGDIIVKNFDWPMAQELAERFKKMLPPELQDAPDGQQAIPPQVQQQLMQSQQMIEQLTQALNQLHDEKEAKTAELESKERIALQNNETQIVLKEMDNNMGLFAAELQHINDRLGLLHQNMPVGDESAGNSPEASAGTRATQ